ncbi:unnamed protein product [Microthlaspi erraticum]|uniref:FKB95-like N-terminal Kelch domain-containing protein n=1 Tax=Microthlaspi erraticum TaxID=1685480 RepID=A0A6D2HJI6_9BRAS|nr:unnamed protein product [Microthlaspi erraticum]
MGGTVEGKRSKDVDVLDCRSHTWRRAAGLTVARKSAKSSFLDGKIYVTGGGEEESESWGEVLDIKSQTWKPLASPSEKGEVDSDHQVVVLGGRLCVITKQKKKYAYDPKEERWVEDVVGFVGLVEPVITGPCCVIDNVLFAEHGRRIKWYDSRCGDWLMVEDLSRLYGQRLRKTVTVQLVNHAGKLVIIWHQRTLFMDRRRIQPDRNIWCAVIRLEKRVDPLGTNIRGHVEQCNAVVYDTYKSFNLLTCQSLSM